MNQDGNIEENIHDNCCLSAGRPPTELFQKEMG